MEKVRAGGEYGYGRIGQEVVGRGLCGGGRGVKGEGRLWWVLMCRE